MKQAEGKNQNLADKQIALAGGGTLKFTILTSGGYGVQIQSQGVNVLLNTGAGWGYEMTPVELTKKDEFYSIYWKEYNAVKNGMNSELKELPDYLEKRPVFEAKVEFTGKIIAILQPRGGVAKSGNEWKAQEYVIEDHGQYPRKMCFDVFGADKIEQFLTSRWAKN